MSRPIHGTYQGFQWHKSRGHRGIEICEDCREAGRDYMRAYARSRYSPERRRAAYERAKERGYYDRNTP